MIQQRVKELTECLRMLFISNYCLCAFNVSSKTHKNKVGNTFKLFLNCYLFTVNI